jgi:hypothetical protein
MRYMLLMNYAAPSHTPDMPMIGEWSPEAIAAHIDFMHDFNAELNANGELVGVEALSGPEDVKIVWFKGEGAPVITDGPFAESKEFLAGYWIIDVETPERALELAAQASMAPGPDGKPIGTEIEVRQVMGAPVPEM